MGLFAIGSSAFGISFGVDVNVLKDAPGPHSMIAWKPGAGSTACGIVVTWWSRGCVFESYSKRLSARCLCKS